VIDPPQGSDAASLADWAELWVFAEGADVLTRGQIKRTLQDEPNEKDAPDDDDDRAGAEIEVAELESMVREDTRADRLLAEIARRGEVAPRIYRFRLEEGVITQTAAPGRSIYQFLHWISLPEAPFRDGREAEAERPFDQLGMAALKVLLGPNADGILFARRYAVDPCTDALRPTSFPDAIRWLRGRLKLPAGLEAVPEGPPPDDEGDHPARTYNDGGVDVVVWRHFADGRAGFPVVLAQCTIQFRWRPKTTDIVLELWGDWIRFVTPAQKVLVVPFAIPEGRSWWRDRNRTAGMILDRMRLCELLDAVTDDELEALDAAQMSGWLNAERETFIATLAA
jgi:hypothetical protein